MIRLLSLALLVLAACRPDAAAQDDLAASAAQAADTLDLPATNFYEITTPQGRMVVELFDDTPLHRDNFKQLVKEQFYDSTRFHRVIDGFMIQGGDPLSKDDDLYDDGTGGPGYEIDAEIKHYHLRGALAAAREGDQVNPERRSSGSQFFIVHGLPVDSLALDGLQVQMRQMLGDPTFAWPDSVRQRYYTEGGYPPLDDQYTVFGRLVEGFDVLDAIATMPTGRKTGQRGPLMDQPPTPVWMIVRPLEHYTPPASAPASDTR